MECRVPSRKKAATCLIALATIGLLSASSIFADESSIDARIDKLERKVQSQADELQTLKAQQAGQKQPASALSDTTFGGYGEIAYNGYIHDGQSSRNQADLKRFVIFLGHRFSDKW